MSATDELRSILVERGVGWRVPPWSDCYMSKHQTLYVAGGVEHIAFETDSGLYLSRLTPAQAIDATLGRGTCYDVGNGTRFVCSECGCSLDLSDLDGEPTMWVKDMADTPNYCPNCGRKVVW